MTLAAENGEKSNPESSCDRNTKLIEGFSSVDQKSHGDALKGEGNSLEGKMARRRPRVCALEQQGAPRRTKSYKVRQGST